MNLHLARKLQKLHEYCSILQYFLKSIVKTIMLGSSTACRIFNDCHSPNSNFSFRGPDRAWWASTAYQSTESAPYKTVLVCNPASIHGELFFFAPGTAIKRYFLLHLQCRQFVLLPTVAVPGNTILWHYLFFAALPESILDGIPVKRGWIVAPFPWGSSPLPHPASSRFVRVTVLVSTGYSQWSWFLQLKHYNMFSQSGETQCPREVILVLLCRINDFRTNVMSFVATFVSFTTEESKYLCKYFINSSVLAHQLIFCYDMLVIWGKYIFITTVQLSEF